MIQQVTNSLTTSRAELVSAEPLHDIEQNELRTNEAKIRHHWEAWLEMGNALISIRKKRLYRETHGTFYAYCRERFGLNHLVILRIIAQTQRYYLAGPVAKKLNIAFYTHRPLATLCHCKATELAEVLRIAASKTAPGVDGIRLPTVPVLTEAIRKVKRRNCSIAEQGNAKPPQTAPALSAPESGKFVKYF